jgi:UDP-N-acetylmuramate: L-alanyl-gamma-D-glutamyl-meso-diaminopimelate ligase
MKVHFIAIGGSAMHNLAISLYKKGYQISGSDDEIFEPSKSRLSKYGILPDKIGWDENNITKDIDAVILGMHAREDNPELLKAREIGLKIYSYPEYLFEQTKDKIRIVIGGSHGKTTITSMIMHVLQYHNMKFDYMVGAQLDGFETMVSLSDDTNIAIFEGDEYLSSPIDRRPKFHLYKPNIAVISGIAWDHINVFPSFENYVEQFEIFIDKIEENGSLFYCDLDSNLKILAQKTNNKIQKASYGVHPYFIKDDITYLQTNEGDYSLKIFGKHNLQNINAAKLVCNEIGVSEKDFYSAISEFKGASKRLEILAEKNNTILFRDFAHSPSKLKATVDAVKEQYLNRRLFAIMELHTFSSLNKSFLKEYKGTLNNADIAVVYFNPQVIEHKKLEQISKEQVKEAFEKINLHVFTDQKKLIEFVREVNLHDMNILLMSSGSFSGIDLKKFAFELVNL